MVSTETLTNYMDCKVHLAVHTDDSDKQFGDVISQNNKTYPIFLKDIKQATAYLHYSREGTSLDSGMNK